MKEKIKKNIKEKKKKKMKKVKLTEQIERKQPISKKKMGKNLKL